MISHSSMDIRTNRYVKRVIFEEHQFSLYFALIFVLDHAFVYIHDTCLDHQFANIQNTCSDHQFVNIVLWSRQDSFVSANLSCGICFLFYCSAAGPYDGR